MTADPSTHAPASPLDVVDISACPRSERTVDEATERHRDCREQGLGVPGLHRC